MNRLGLLLVCCVLLGACTVVDGGVGRASGWNTHFGANAYAEYRWPTNDTLLTLDLFGGPNSFTLVRADLWRLLHLEFGLLGLELGLGPLQFGAGVGLYVPGASAGIGNDLPTDG